MPDGSRTFDHRRPVTALAHLIEDHQRGVSEADLTHLPEVLELHDLARDPDAGSKEEFRLRSEKNVENRCLHHHVFDLALARDMVEHGGMKILATQTAMPFHIMVVAEKPL